MADYDLKSIAADTDGPSADNELLFGSPDQSSGTPKPYSFAGIKAWIKSWRGVGLMHPGYKAGNWYVPAGFSANTLSSTNGILGNIQLLPFIVPQKITLSDLAVNVITAQAASNCQLAIYNSNPIDPTRPGTLVAATGSIATTTTGNKSAAFAGAATPQLDVGVYFFAVNTDVSNIVFSSMGATSFYSNQMLGSATLNNMLGVGGNSNNMQLSVAQAFGTWPDLTAASFTEGLAVTRSPLPAFKVASVP